MTSSRRDPAAVILLPDAQRDLQLLRSHAAQFLSRLQTLSARPERGHLLRGALAGARSLVLSYQGGGYRAVYVYDPAKNECRVLAIGEHATVYETAAYRFPAP
ncbi:MAG: type II toxin-antitoxin system RelE family toxin [Dehalococcoidia bacterium]